MKTTFERLAAILAKEYKFDRDKLTPEVPLEELQIDSLGVSLLMFNIEDEFKINLTTEPGKLTTVGDVVRYIDGVVAAQQSKPSVRPIGPGSTPPT